MLPKRVFADKLSKTRSFLIGSSFQHLADWKNPQSQFDWVADSLRKISESHNGMKLALLDVGAGESPFRSICENLGFRYQSQDFNQYIPDPELPGLQNDSWNYGTHDLVCDILDIPEHDTYDVLLCTEVLEHVPDPRAVFSKLRRLASPGAHIIVTVPLHSLLHQAPFWFSSGLSPFWFQNAARQEGVLIEELFVGGDYADFISQEINRTLSGLQLWFPANFAAKALGRIMGKSAKVFRRLLPTSILGSGGFGTFFVGKCPEIEL